MIRTNDAEYFKNHRYDKNRIIDEIETLDTIENILNLKISETETIEVYIKDDRIADKDTLKIILANISKFDDIVQNFCELNYQKSTYPARNYIVELSWISITCDRIVLRYWGCYVNFELEAIFTKLNMEWEKEDIYYC